MSTVPDEVRQRLEQHDQGHVVASWGRLDDTQRRELLAQIETIDLPGLRALHKCRDKPAATTAASIEPVTVVAHDNPLLARCRHLGTSPSGNSVPGEISCRD